jgi:hypothetical protein
MPIMPTRDPPSPPEEDGPGRWRAPALVLAAFTTLGLLFSTQTWLDAMYSRAGISASQALILALAGWYGWALLFPAGSTGSPVAFRSAARCVPDTWPFTDWQVWR